MQLPIRPRPAADLCLLTWAAGAMDALSYVRSGVFTANMTGNTVVLGLAIAGPARSRAFHALLALGAFAVGAAVAALVLLRHGRTREEAEDLRLGLALELPLAAAFSLLWVLFPAGGPPWEAAAGIGIAACALGIQSVAVRRLKIRGVVTTFITGTITTAILSYLERNDPAAEFHEQALHSPLLLGVMWALYILAAMAGGMLAVANSPLAGLMVLAALLAVFLRAWWGSRHPS